MGFQANFFAQFIDLPFFTKQTLSGHAQMLKISPASLSTYISRGLKRGQIIQLKRGVYVMREFFDTNKSKQSYLFYLANNLLLPSYVSLESALQHYGLLTEAINIATTSISMKLPRQFKSRLGMFEYKNITGDLFHGFKTVRADFNFVIAAPHKAIFDYLYYRTHQFKSTFSQYILEDFRIDVDAIGKDEKNLLGALLKKYTNQIIHL